MLYIVRFVRTKSGSRVGAVVAGKTEADAIQAAEKALDANGYKAIKFFGIQKADHYILNENG
jgi:xanthine/CO dehydrogenase XdhC/CoxF family maturation factor